MRLTVKKSTIASTSTLALLLALAIPAEAGWEEGVAAFRAQNYAQAIEEFRVVVEDQPEWAGGHRMLGQSFLMPLQPLQQ